MTIPALVARATTWARRARGKVNTGKGTKRERSGPLVLQGAWLRLGQYPIVNTNFRWNGVDLEFIYMYAAQERPAAQGLKAYTPMHEGEDSLRAFSLLC